MTIAVLGVTADHPFLYFTEDKKTGIILFAGVLMNPAGAGN